MVVAFLAEMGVGLHMVAIGRVRWLPVIPD